METLKLIIQNKKAQITKLEQITKILKKDNFTEIDIETFIYKIADFSPFRLCEIETNLIILNKKEKTQLINNIILNK